MCTGFINAQGLVVDSFVCNDARALDRARPAATSCVWYFCKEEFHRRPGAHYLYHELHQCPEARRHRLRFQWYQRIGRFATKGYGDAQGRFFLFKSLVTAQGLVSALFGIMPAPWLGQGLLRCSPVQHWPPMRPDRLVVCLLHERGLRVPSVTARPEFRAYRSQGLRCAQVQPR